MDENELRRLVERKKAPFGIAGRGFLTPSSNTYNDGLARPQEPIRCPAPPPNPKVVWPQS
jgi:hypothetical protein